MLRSMTGYGKELISLPEKTITIEIRTLNSKLADINIKSPAVYREKDIEVRHLLHEKLERGKIDFQLFVENIGDKSNFSLNQSLAKKYYNELKSLADDIGEDDFDEFLPVLVKLPDVLHPEIEKLNPEEWEDIKKTINIALDKVIAYRIEEGSSLEKDLIARIQSIINYLSEIAPYEQDRIKKRREDLLVTLNNLKNSITVDKNRFEQELIYYMEKLDITEEKIRLKKHCEYFLDTISRPGSVGKKLTFIVQEIGREINTLGAKANNAEIQKIVVQMKDELEKIREQLANIL
ncbi:MAG: YicC family protein [Bacteroidales bacterium]|nr:YicC family protein [Bacteroidales bacterium]